MVEPANDTDVTTSLTGTPSVPAKVTCLPMIDPPRLSRLVALASVIDFEIWSSLSTTLSWAD